MRIAILSDSVFPTPMAGGHGLGCMVHQIAEGLYSRGHDVTLFAAPGSRFSGNLVTPKDAGGQNGYDGEHAIARDAMRRHAEWRFDVFLSNDHLHVLAALFPQLPVVNVYHDIWQGYARCPVVLSTGQRALMPPEFAGARLIFNALDPEGYEPTVKAQEPPFALFLGALADHKQPILAIEACARAGVKLVIAGASLQGTFPIEGNTENVEYRGVVGPKERNHLMQQARVFLQLGRVEAFGLTTLEAMLHGTPIVAWPAGGSLDLVRYGETGVFVPRTTGDVVGAVADAIARAWRIDRRRVRDNVLDTTFCNVSRQIDQYEDALAACMRGDWW